MKTYRVEEMDGQTVFASHEAKAKTPFEAAEKALGLKVTLRGEATKWVRAVELIDNKPTRLFEYRALGIRG